MVATAATSGLPACPVLVIWHYYLASKGDIGLPLIYLDNFHYFDAVANSTIE